ENLRGGAFDDSLYGTNTFNVLSGGAGEDRLFGRAGPDTVLGGGGNDLLEGGSGDDNLEGEDGDDVLRGGAGNDFVFGGEGADMVDYAASASFVHVDLAIFLAQDIGFNEGIDTIRAVEYATGSSLDDELRGTSHANKLWGLGGND